MFSVAKRGVPNCDLFNIIVKGGRVMVFCFVQKFFFRQHESKNIYFFCDLILDYMTKTLNQIIFFFSTKIRIFFSATLGIRIFFLEKNHNPPFKLNGRSLSIFYFITIMLFVSNIIPIDLSVVYSKNMRIVIYCIYILLSYLL